FGSDEKGKYFCKRGWTRMARDNPSGKSLPTKAASAPSKSASGADELSLVGCSEHLPAGRYSVDCRGNADVGHELHHNLDELLARNAATQGSADMGPQLRR